MPGARKNHLIGESGDFSASRVFPADEVVYYKQGAQQAAALCDEQVVYQPLPAAEGGHVFVVRVIGIVGGERIEQLVKQLVVAVRSHDAQRRGEKNVLERQKFELFAVLIIGADDFEILHNIVHRVDNLNVAVGLFRVRYGTCALEIVIPAPAHIFYALRGGVELRRRAQILEPRAVGVAYTGGGEKLTPVYLVPRGGQLEQKLRILVQREHAAVGTGGSGQLLQHIPALVDGKYIENADIKAPIQRGEYRVERTGGEIVVAVYKEQVFPVGVINAGVARVADPAVRRGENADERGIARGVISENGRRAVGRAVVDKDNFIAVAAADKRVDALRQVFFNVIYGYDYAELQHMNALL